MLHEDHTTRCYDESLNLFRETATNQAFESTDFIIFLNDHDLFQEKIQSIPFTVYNEHFTEEEATDGEAVINWVRQEFRSRLEEATESMHGQRRHSAKQTESKNGKDSDEKEEQKYNAQSRGQSEWWSKKSGGSEEGEIRGGGDGRRRGLHFHLTSATSTDQIETVVKYMQIELIRKLMSRASLLKGTGSKWF